MTDFTRWLYANYIRPHIKAQDATGYETPLSLLEKESSSRTCPYCGKHL